MTGASICVDVIGRVVSVVLLITDHKGGEIERGSRGVAGVAHGESTVARRLAGP